MLLSAETGEPGSVRMTATDTMVALVIATPHASRRQAMSTRRRSSRSRALPEPSVHLVADHRLADLGGKSVFNIVRMRPEDFPPLRAATKSMLKVTSKDLRRLIEETHFSVSADDNPTG